MAVADSDVFERFPDVLITYDNVEHYRGLLERRLLVNRCGDCGFWIYPHRPLCPECWSWRVTATEVSGRGEIYMFTRVQQARAHDKAGQALGASAVLVAVELVEQAGLRYLSTVVGIGYEDLRHGMPVELTWVDRQGHLVPAFRPIKAGREGAGRG